jgi:uncharacterized protein YqgV (UPF0045/DUF77 family)
MLHAEVSIYPLKTENASGIVSHSIMVLDNENVDYKVGSIATHVHGPDDDLWKSLKDMYDRAQEGGEVNMVITISNAAGE